MDTTGLVIITLATILGIGPIATILDIIRTATFVAAGEVRAALASVNSDSPWFTALGGPPAPPKENFRDTGEIHVRAGRHRNRKNRLRDMADATGESVKNVAKTSEEMAAIAQDAKPDAAELAGFRAAYTSGTGLANAVVKSDQVETVYRYGDASREAARRI
jgi:hypothetical protein